MFISIKKSQEYGRSMIEMLGVLSIVGVLSVGGISGYSKALDKYKQIKLIEQINETVTNIRTIYLNQKSYEGLNTQTAKQLGLLAKDMYLDASSGTETNAYGGRVYVFSSPYNDSENKSFEFYLTALPQHACESILIQDWGNDVSSGFVGIIIQPNTLEEMTGPIMEDIKLGDVSNVSEGIFTVGKHENALPISLSVAVSTCSSCQTTGCIIGFKYQ